MALTLRPQPSSLKVLALRYESNSLPGRTLNEVYGSLGSVAETVANRVAHRLGMGPLSAADRINRFFDGEGGEAKERKIAGLRSDQSMIGIKTLRKDCAKLLAYTASKQATRTRIDAFWCIVDVATRYPGLRHFFLETHIVPSPVSVDGLCAFWKPQHCLSPEDAKEFDFVVKLTATCLADGNIAILVEANPRQNPRIEGCNTGLTVVEFLLVTLWSRTLAEPSVSLSVRYLAGILELKSFWLQSGPIFDDVLRKVNEHVCQMLEDLDIKQQAQDETESLMDFDGLDALLTALQAGIHDMTLSRKMETTTLQDCKWYQSAEQVVSLLRFPKAEALFPNAHAWAITDEFQRWFPTPYRVQEFTVVVPVTGRDAEDHEYFDQGGHSVVTEEDDVASDVSSVSSDATSVISKEALEAEPQAAPSIRRNTDNERSATSESRIDPFDRRFFSYEDRDEERDKARGTYLFGREVDERFREAGLPLGPPPVPGAPIQKARPKISARFFKRIR
ncbi:hypothetical protein MIND_00545200 [Mycena indigotica]|uniref:Uncharacterized protein n=1 Tax=Mycena indigotica TaxID=2126181 RepID=A0A8H6SZ93_9AGAR|nr:uncharacterized protein MIND_00545200 [Mycena indigotica]KAF7307507.1 hypothetical protein MIND_00545200 [Mycena indigotica]